MLHRASHARTRRHDRVGVGVGDLAQDLLPPFAADDVAHLIAEHRPGRYQTHDLLRAYATELLDEAGAEERAAAEDRCLRFYRSAAAAAHQQFATRAQRHEVPDPGPDVASLIFPDRVAAMSWLEAEAQVLAAYRSRGHA